MMRQVISSRTKTIEVPPTSPPYVNVSGMIFGELYQWLSPNGQIGMNGELYIRVEDGLICFRKGYSQWIGNPNSYDKFVLAPPSISLVIHNPA
jgi:hypothetical protein